MANNGTGERLPRSEHELIDRDSVIDFEFEGRQISAYKGDTVGSAVTAVGIDILSRSFKYHRPRGMLCAAGNCPNCLMTVDGIPNVRSCTMQVQPGMKVKITWSSALKPRTALPTSRTIPLASWPSTIGVWRGREPLMTDKSEWHSPAPFTSTNTSSSAGPASSSS